MFDYRQDGKWWDIGLDLVTGCTPVSPGCAHCWSAEKAHRAGHQRNPKIRARYGGLTDADGRWTGEIRLQWQDLNKIGRARKPQVYTFWNDLFHPAVTVEFVDMVLDRIERRPEHFYIICIKRPERALEYFDTQNWQDNALQHRLMLMTTAENQAIADLRVPILLQIPGVMHGVSYEPALGPIDFSPWLPIAPRGDLWKKIKVTSAYGQAKPPMIDWIIAGGETGSRARPMYPDWPRQVRDQCRAAGMPFFFKIWGEYLHESQGYDISLPRPFPNCEINNGPGSRKGYLWADGTWSIRVGKKTAGRLLDGRTWDETPAL